MASVAEVDQYEAALKKAVSSLENKDLLGRLDKSVLKFLFKYIEENTTIKNGKVVFDSDTVRGLKGLNRAIDLHFRESLLLAQYMKLTSGSIMDAGKLTNDFYEKVNKGFNASRIRNNQRVIVNEYIQSLNGLNESFKQPVRQQILNNLNNGDSFSTIKDNLRAQIKGNGGSESGLLKRYLDTNARAASNAYRGVTSKFFYEEFKSDITHIAIIGTLIETSSPQCKRSILKYNSRVPIDKFKSEILPLAKKNGLRENTTVDNVYINQLHWGCRHEFVSLIL